MKDIDDQREYLVNDLCEENNFEGLGNTDEKYIELLKLYGNKEIIRKIIKARITSLKKSKSNKDRETEKPLFIDKENRLQSPKYNKIG